MDHPISKPIPKRLPTKIFNDTDDITTRISRIEKLCIKLEEYVENIDRKVDKVLNDTLQELRRSYNEHSEIQVNIIDEMMSDNSEMARQIEEHEKKDYVTCICSKCKKISHIPNDSDNDYYL